MYLCTCIFELISIVSATICLKIFTENTFLIPRNKICLKVLLLFCPSFVNIVCISNMYNAHICIYCMYVFFIVKPLNLDFFQTNIFKTTFICDPRNIICVLCKKIRPKLSLIKKLTTLIPVSTKQTKWVDFV